jgi:hypothetical protein
MPKKDLNPTFIPVRVPTNYQHADKIEEASVQLENLSFQLESLFFFVRNTCLMYDHLEMSEDQLMYNFNSLRGQLEGVCALGTGLASAVQVCAENLTVAAKDLQSKIKEPSSLKKVS